MRIATQNIEFLFDEGLHTHSGKEWMYGKELVDARIAYFAKRFQAIDADILLLQEIASMTVIERIIAKSGIDYVYFFATPDINGVGNVVLYRRELGADCETIPAVASCLPVFVTGDTDTLGPRVWSRRDFVHLSVDWKGQKLHVLNIHIKANFLVPEKNTAGIAHPMHTQIDTADGLIRSEVFRFSQAKKLREYIDALYIQDPNTVIVVGGDFNAEENFSVFRIVQGVIKDAANTLLSSTASIDSQIRFSSTSTTMGRKRLLDHILISKNLETALQKVEILNSDISEATGIAPNPTLVGSDHAPIVVDLA